MKVGYGFISGRCTQPDHMHDAIRMKKTIAAVDALMIEASKRIDVTSRSCQLPRSSKTRDLHYLTTVDSELGVTFNELYHLVDLGTFYIVHFLRACG